MSLCGECAFFVNVNDFPLIINNPEASRFIKCKKGKTMDSLSYTCGRYDGPVITPIERMGKIVDQSIDEGVSMRELSRRLSPPGGEHLKHKPVLILRGGHDEPDSPQDEKKAHQEDEVEEDSESSPPLKPKLKLRKTIQLTFGDF